MEKIRIGINGFGRIGRVAARIILERKELELAAVNSRSEISSHAYLLKYDSVYGTLNKDVTVKENKLMVDNRPVEIFNFDKPSEIPWEETKTDIVIDATGKFRTKTDLEGHLRHNVKFVILSAPAKDDIKTLVLGVNEKSFNRKKDKIISNSSCTTNCMATCLSVLKNNFGVKRGFMTTIHAATDSQNLLDNSHKKEVRLRRASFASMIPASTGSAKDISKLYPELTGKLICQAIRIPLLTVSLINLTAETEKNTDQEMVNKAYIRASKKELKGILDVAGEQLVSKDFTGNTHSSIVDPYLTQVIDRNLVNIYAWYDNEWGYTSRLADMVGYIGGLA